MTSLSDYKFYNLQEEIDKYTKFEDNLDNISIDNENNKHKVRDDFIDILIKKLKLPELYTKDLEIGVFNATIDYANNYGIQLSWKNQMLVETYVNISRSIYSNIKKDSYVGNKDLYQRMVKKKEFTPHMLPYMQYQNIFPERWKDIIEKNQIMASNSESLSEINQKLKLMHISQEVELNRKQIENVAQEMKNLKAKRSKEK